MALQEGDVLERVLEGVLWLGVLEGVILLGYRGSS